MATEEGRPTVTFETQEEIDAYKRGWNEACAAISRALAESAARAANRGETATSLTLVGAAGVLLTMKVE